MEGSVGGFFGGALGGLLAYAVGRYVPGVDWGLLPALGQALVLGLICGGIGQIGDLFASTSKRWAGIKDYGKIFPDVYKRQVLGGANTCLLQKT